MRFQKKKKARTGYCRCGRTHKEKENCTVKKKKGKVHTYVHHPSPAKGKNTKLNHKKPKAHTYTYSEATRKWVPFKTLRRKGVKKESSAAWTPSWTERVSCQHHTSFGIHTGVSCQLPRWRGVRLTPQCSLLSCLFTCLIYIVCLFRAKPGSTRFQPPSNLRTGQTHIFLYMHRCSLA